MMPDVNANANTHVNTAVNASPLDGLDTEHMVGQESTNCSIEVESSDAKLRKALQLLKQHQKVSNPTAKGKWLETMYLDEHNNTFGFYYK
jgi:hypothetical protein